jgi:dihydrofolate reductase
MSDVVLQVSSMSVDGVITAAHTPDDAWANEPDAERDEWMTESLSEASVHVMGARTYRDMAAYWPGSTEIFAEPMNRIPKAVFSRTLVRRDTVWGPVEICAGDTREELARLQQSPAGPVFAHGGIAFMRSLAQLDVVDEYRLVISPWISGSGACLFQGVLAGRRLSLTELTGFPSGAFAAVYRRARQRAVVT